jgi:hypothetical protein
MPSSSKPKTTTPRLFVGTRAAFDVSVHDWSKRLYTAVSKAGQYSKDHEDFFKEFNKLRDDGQALNVTVVTMVNHVAPIYNHIALHGYKAHIHYLPLKEAVVNFCESKPVADWKAPPDELSRSSLSPSPPPSPRPRAKEEPPRKNAGTTKKKGKAKAAVLDELLRSDHDESERESGKPRKPATDKVENLPTTDGMETSPTRCTLCENRGHVCHVNPKATKAAAACFECNHWRVKCSLATRGKKGEAPAEEEEAAASKEPTIVVKRRKKPAQVPAGQPGQISCEVLLFLLMSGLIFFSLADSLAPDIFKKLESYESGASQLLEKIEEQSQAIARLTAENRSTREWFKTRLELLYESTSKRDEAIAESMKGILEHVEEMSRHIGLRQAGEKLEALLNAPTLAVPIPTLSSLPNIRAATPKTTSTPKTPTQTAEPSDTAQPSNKRTADEIHDSSETKRRKVGEP